ncbi:hypothetical protein H9Q10_09115 [Eikenella sp. S3360]|uniref:Uncharacterized protein n=1 Tax=Eikenella glucosivorans TaxID=2766967 RepID=A0ABS0NBZ9_9NEIS|nr:hypothetical protein [Eikenella glucosivorans]MBH5329827.1 hypothetical protein [Eikenella glucosivorans]
MICSATFSGSLLQWERLPENQNRRPSIHARQSTCIFRQPQAHNRLPEK